MKNQIAWWKLFIGAIIVYGLGALIGGIVGSACTLLGFILLVMGVIDLVRIFSNKGK